MDDGRSIRYKDLYALFEHILEKNMRLEQRDWSESPVKVWVNTFKVFLDEFMTEYKPMDGTISKVKHLSLGPQTSIVLQNSSETLCLFFRLLNLRGRRGGKRNQTPSVLVLNSI